MKISLPLGSYIYIFCNANNKRTAIVRCSYNSILRSRASFDGRKTILWMHVSRLLAICKTVAELTGERLAKYGTFISRTLHATYVCCTIILQLSYTFYDTCDFFGNMAANDRRQVIIRPKKIVSLM